MGNEGQKLERDERRRHKRFKTVNRGIIANISSVNMTEILDISVGGALLQTYIRLNMFREHWIEIAHNGKQYPVKGAIVWSFLKECTSDWQGNNTLIYHSGMQFSHVPKELESFILLLGTDHSQQREDSAGSEEYYPFNIDALNISGEERAHLETHLGSVYGQGLFDE